MAAILLLAAGGAAAAAADWDFPVAEPVRIIEQREDLPVLLVEYPWDVHRGASIEVRLVTAEEAEMRRLRPLFFTARAMRGEITSAVYRVEDGALVMPVRETVAADDRRYELVGDRNELGRAAVRAVWNAPRRDPLGGAAAVYPLLSRWALGRDLLQLELPEPAFDSPGRLRVWLLRGERIVWQQDLAWPGR